MEGSNAEVARRVIEGFAREPQDWMGYLDPDIEYTPVRQWPEPSTLHGPDALRGFVRDILADFDAWEIRVKEVRENADRVFVEATVRSVGGKSGVELKGRVFHVLTFRDGRVVRLQDFFGRGDARLAAGLPT